MTDLTPTLAYLHERITRRPRVMLILGSGMGALADELEEPVRVAFADIPGFAPATVAGHRGLLVAGRLEGVECIALQGRYHVYEGHAPDVVTLPIRVLAALGARTLLVSNAAGGVNPGFRAGDLMLLDDHINLMWRNPLIGAVVPGDERFPDMSEPYDRELQALAERVARAQGIRLVRGVYCAVAGPSYETRAEIALIRRLGADAVGMSTVPEVLVARALGMRVLGISLISNAAAGLTAKPLTHEEVLEASAAAAPRFGALIRGCLRELARLPEVEVA
ncbi:MAG: purine-nucleoside phosphorylase [Gemmatimonadetes bacterium]|nr:purine-nucleoside phosphorylase [Gemmatimonadota bacterium]